MLTLIVCSQALAYQFAYSDQGEAHRWKLTPISWYSEDGQVPESLPLDQTRQAVREAVAVWQDVPAADIGFVETPASERGPFDNRIVWLDEWPFGEDQLAVTTRYARPSGEVLGFEIMFDGTRDDWAIGGRGFDVQAAATHEVGHALGLEHSEVSEATMFATTGERDVERRWLSTDDRLAVQDLYPVQAASCDISHLPSGSWAFLVPALLVAARPRFARGTPRSTGRVPES